jgi:hypothetical protein
MVREFEVLGGVSRITDKCCPHAFEADVQNAAEIPDNGGAPK